jgi:hypothetical protein
MFVVLFIGVNNVNEEKIKGFYLSQSLIILACHQRQYYQYLIMSGLKPLVYDCLRRDDNNNYSKSLPIICHFS